jgi:hypothetical protein
VSRYCDIPAPLVRQHVFRNADHVNTTPLFSNLANMLCPGARALSDRTDKSPVRQRFSSSLLDQNELDNHSSALGQSSIEQIKIYYESCNLDILRLTVDAQRPEMYQWRTAERFRLLVELRRKRKPSMRQAATGHCKREHVSYRRLVEVCYDASGWSDHELR